MLLVCISIQDESIGIFSHRVLYTKTWFSLKIFISFINFLDQKCANSFYEWNIYWKILVTHEDLYSSKIFMNFGLKMCYWYLLTKMCQFFLWLIYILGLLEKILDIDRRYYWHKELYMKTWYSSKSFLILFVWFFGSKIC